MSMDTPTEFESEGAFIMPVPISGGKTGLCTNCGSPVVGQFCSQCGQKANVKRITWREGWNDFWARIYGFDGMFPRTLRDLTIRPGHATREFLNGNRVKYYGPVGYFFFIISLYVLVMSMLEIDPHEVIRAMGADYTKPGTGQAQFNSQMVTWMNNNQRLVSFLMIPFYVLGAKLFFRREKLNYLEHSVLIFYTQGHLQWFSILSLCSLAWLGLFPGFFYFVSLQFVYYSIACVQLYRSYRPWSAFIRGLLVNLFFWIVFMLAISIAIGIAVASDPVLMEQIRPSNNQ